MTWSMRSPFTKPNSLVVPVDVEHPRSGDVPTSEKPNETGPVTVEPRDGEDDSTDTSAQDGVQNVEAMAKVWTRSNYHRLRAQGTTSALTAYVTSDFKLHSLTAATSIMSSIIGGLFKLPLAKILDIWGRPQGFALTTFLMIMGLIMMAACKNVQTYAAAQVFYWVGYNGMTYTMSIFVADTTSLKNRGFWFAVISSPYIVTTWCSGPLATAYLNGPGFRWSFGSFAIITVVVTVPLGALFMHNYRKAKRAGLIVQKSSGRTPLESLKHYLIEFDAFGILILASGLALFLLPFSLYSYQGEGWRAPMIICMIIFGGLLLIAFGFYEAYFARKTFIPFGLLVDRTVFGACILAAVLFVEFYIWDSYFYSFLQVVNGLDITKATYVTNIYSIGACFWSLVVGVLIRWSGRFKWLALYFGVPLTMLGVGLMIAFRQPDVNIGYVVMCQIFIAFSGGTLVICEQIAVMAATSHQHIAVVLAIEGVFSSIGGAIGSTIAAAVWTGVSPEKLSEYLPPESQANFTSIYGSIDVQLSYPQGSDTRLAIQRAYGDAQKWMIVGATAVLVFAIASTAVWRDIKVKDFKQVKGRVF